ncbi:MAG TPA: M15 family metallopeptidase [Phycisphaerae bacterium]|nr:M15 family metallopeptidase [Phycisphaerae bacterium]
MAFVRRMNQFAIRGVSPRRLFACLALLALPASLAAFPQQTPFPHPGPKPPDVPNRWKPWIGEYAAAHSSVPISVTTVIAEQDGSIEFLERTESNGKFTYRLDSSFKAKGSSPSEAAHGLRTDASGKRLFVAGDVVSPEISEPFGPATAVVHPASSIAELRAAALAAPPPAEAQSFRPPDLVEIAPLDPAIHLDIRYATANNFLGTPVYTQARAFLQRPAAEALLRALQKLKPLGYGLLIHDGYRPWYVTKIFWDATPPEGHIFVADPGKGSRHNRGCAVDLTLFDLKTGAPIEMTGNYDEMSPRSFPDYPGGTSLQRWHRDLLRWAMESEGFSVYEAEWWHFDFKDWPSYRILNIPFEQLSTGSTSR